MRGDDHENYRRTREARLIIKLCLRTALEVAAALLRAAHQRPALRCVLVGGLSGAGALSGTLVSEVILGIQIAKALRVRHSEKEACERERGEQHHSQRLGAAVGL